MKFTVGGRFVHERILVSIDTYFKRNATKSLSLMTPVKYAILCKKSIGAQKNPNERTGSQI
jgi:hypothetical protein